MAINVTARTAATRDHMCTAQLSRGLACTHDGQREPDRTPPPTIGTALRPAPSVDGRELAAQAQPARSVFVLPGYPASRAPGHYVQALRAGSSENPRRGRKLPYFA